MRAGLRFILLGGALLASGQSAIAQTDPNPALNAPDKLAWQLFIQVNTSAGGSGNNATFETWASDTDLFRPIPQFPSAPVPLALRAPIVPTVGREAIPVSYTHLTLPTILLV